MNEELLPAPTFNQSPARTPSDSGLPAATKPPGHVIPIVHQPHGLVFNLQRYSVHDGPGIRTTVFLKGCPLRCAWCHNPEGISPIREMIILENRCIACGECRKACDFGELETTGPLPVMNGRCKWCGACVDSCPTGARQIIGREMTVEHVLAEIQKDRVFFEESGGGVTFSGGEPFMQPAFLKALLTACRAAGFHTAVDTCGMAPLGEVLGIAPLADLLLYDLKSMDDGRHRDFTGVSNRMILENLQALSRVHPHIWIRVPLVPGVNDDLPSLELMARLVRNLPGLHPVNVLPFHRTGRPKARRLGRTDRMEDISPPSAATVELAVSVFRRFGLDAKVGG